MAKNNNVYQCLSFLCKHKEIQRCFTVSLQRNHVHFSPGIVDNVSVVKPIVFCYKMNKNKNKDILKHFCCVRPFIIRYANVQHFPYKCIELFGIAILSASGSSGVNRNLIRMR